jgi:hypothetical protein
LTNSYYLDVLDHFLPKLQSIYTDGYDRQLPYPVSIYSQRESLENWTDLTNRNYAMHSDTDLNHDAVYSMISANTLSFLQLKTVPQSLCVSVDSPLPDGHLL